MQQLNGQRFLVIGGSSGIGLATAIAAARAGALVTIASRSVHKLAAALLVIANDATSIALDTTNYQAVERFFADEVEWDHVVVSAAETVRGPVRELALDAARAAMESKFWGAYHVGRAARIKSGGSLTFISGFMAERPSAIAVLQGAINSGIEGLARGLALEMAPTRVNTVSPGLIDTPLWSHMSAENRSAIFDDAAQCLPAKRAGRPEEVANAIMFLATTPFATGSTVRIDGGGVIA